MVPVLDVPMIDLALARGHSVRWGSQHVNVSGTSASLRKHLAGHREVAVLDEGAEPIGQAATLRRLLADLTDTVVTYNCDLVSDLDLETLLQSHTDSGKLCTLAVKEVAHGADLAGTENGLRLVDRRMEDTAGYLFLGAACFDRRLLGAIPAEEPLGLVAGVLRPALEAGQVNLFEHRGLTYDAGTPGRYLQASLAALERAELAVRPPGCVSAEGWYLGPGAEAERTSLGRGAIVLAGSLVEPGAQLQDCIVWPGSVVPAGRNLKQGIWLQRAWLPA